LFDTPSVQQAFFIIFKRKITMKRARKVTTKKVHTPEQDKIAEVMHEFKEGELHSGKSGVVVTNRKQAIAIALSEAHELEEETAKKPTKV
jgi:ribosomal protein L21E